jgi:hypothetical protein
VIREGEHLTPFAEAASTPTATSEPDVLCGDGRGRGWCCLGGWRRALAAGESFEAFEMRVKTVADAARASPSLVN